MESKIWGEKESEKTSLVGQFFKVDLRVCHANASKMDVVFVLSNSNFLIKKSLNYLIILVYHI